MSQINPICKIMVHDQTFVNKVFSVDQEIVADSSDSTLYCIRDVSP